MNIAPVFRILGFFVLFYLQMDVVRAQKKKIILKDSLDGKFDMSDYIIDLNGFIPVPILITEPAVGGFGGGIVPVFLKKNPPYIDSVNGKLKVTPVAPNITGALALYTINGTWMTGIGRSGTLVKSGIKYRLGIAYANLNISFYRTLPNQEAQTEFKMNIRSLPLLASGIKRLGYSNWYSGLQYLFMYNKLAANGKDSLPSFVKEIEKNSTIGLVSGIIQFDNRDNIFTPDNGLKFHVDGGYSDQVFGSDYEFWKINYYVFMYKQLASRLTGGLRIDGQQTFGNPPFYFLPFVDMRGVAAARYQGQAEILSEAEFRYDLLGRWSIVGFGGAGKAFDEWDQFGGAKWVVSGGAGVRYLIARKFKLRMGVDLAKGPDTWAYYIVFGTSWKK
jgi:hypothetical protein